MTDKEIANHIIEQFKTDSGIVLGIPAKYQEVLRSLLKLAAQMGKEEPDKRYYGLY